MKSFRIDLIFMWPTYRILNNLKNTEGDLSLGYFQSVILLKLHRHSSVTRSSSVDCLVLLSKVETGCVVIFFPLAPEPEVDTIMKHAIALFSP